MWDLTTFFPINSSLQHTQREGQICIFRKKNTKKTLTLKTISFKSPGRPPPFSKREPERTLPRPSPPFPFQPPAIPRQPQQQQPRPSSTHHLISLPITICLHFHLFSWPYTRPQLPSSTPLTVSNSTPQCRPLVSIDHLTFAQTGHQQLHSRRQKTISSTCPRNQPKDSSPQTQIGPPFSSSSLTDRTISPLHSASNSSSQNNNLKPAAAHPLLANPASP